MARITLEGIRKHLNAFDAEPGFRVTTYTNGLMIVMLSIF